MLSVFYESPYIYHREVPQRPPTIHPERWAYRIYAYDLRYGTKVLENEAAQRLRDKNWFDPGAVIRAVSQPPLTYRGAYQRSGDLMDSLEASVLNEKIESSLSEGKVLIAGESIR